MAARLGRDFGAGVERLDLTATQIRSDIALLADETASSSLFGSARYIRVDGVADDCLAAVAAVLDAPVAGHPVILVAGALKKDSRLLRRLAGDARASTVASYLPDAVDLSRGLCERGIALGLRIDGDAATRIVSDSNGDREISMRELEKLADYLDAAPDQPRRADEASIDAVGAARQDGDGSGVVDALCGSDERRLEHAFANLPNVQDEAVPIVRAALRRLIAMAAVRAEAGRGVPLRVAVDSVGRSMFWRDRESIKRDVPAWDDERLARAIARIGSAEAELKSGTGAGGENLRRLFSTLARRKDAVKTSLR